ncbi:MAG: hypothetical protein Q4F83_11065 [Eubacteriales bacterium]|nr:hypothetical protein [Eubacteriales bacterium]
MKNRCAAEYFMITIGFAAAFMIIVLMLLEVSGKPDRQQDYVVIERDYGGDILLDQESGIRYLRTDDGMYEIEEEIRCTKQK